MAAQKRRFSGIKDIPKSPEGGQKMYKDIKVKRLIQPREKGLLGMAGIGAAISLYNWVQIHSSQSSLDNAVALFGFGVATLLFAYHGLKPSVEYKYAEMKAANGHKVWFRALSFVLLLVVRLVGAAIAMLAAMLGQRGQKYEAPDNPYINPYSSATEAVQSIQEGKDPNPAFYRS
ncbi:hypothetical protein DOK_11836 [gamma proteobacterium BDW918]|nr:hypothetical protein DOK_11836 [gamma proteobacterium BDW918]